jgi:hypothetical protein
MANPETGKQGSLIGSFDSSGGLTGVTWKDNTTNFADKVLSIAPFLVGGVAGLGALGAFGGAAAGGASAALPTYGGAFGLESGLAGVGSTWAGSSALPTLGGAFGLEEGLAGVGSSGSGGSSYLSNLFKSGASKLIGNKDGSSGGWLAALANMYSQNRQGDYQSDMSNRLMGDRQWFLDRLQQTYTNPRSYLESPEYQAAADITLNRLMRQDAAKGRLAADPGRQLLLEQHALANLDKYRGGLSRDFGLTNQPISYAQLGLSGLANQMGMFNAPLAQMGRGQANNTFDLGSVIGDVGDWFGDLFDWGTT